MAPGSALAGLLDSLAVEAGEVTAALVGGMTEYRRGATLFALVEDDVAEFRLDPEIADAAGRTPAAGASRRGAEWVRFAPMEFDRHAADRARAWFFSAWRAAAKR